MSSTAHTEDPAEMKGAARFYAKARGSMWFLFGLVAFITIWVAAHFLYGLDKDWGVINLILSAEASVSLAFFAMISEQQERAALRGMEHITQIIELRQELTAHSIKLDEHIEKVALHALGKKLLTETP
ncbi:MAG: hypothetical protein ACYDBH_00450 [Acidobacteriaceae bacterium]